mgnify:CR=1 FL=1
MLTVKDGSFAIVVDDESLGRMELFDMVYPEGYSRPKIFNDSCKCWFALHNISIVNIDRGVYTTEKSNYDLLDSILSNGYMVYVKI